MNGRVRVKRGKNVKRWKKGQSGGSNPVSHKHRDAAKGRFGNHLVQGEESDSKLALTTDLLATHDAFQGDLILQSEEGEHEFNEGSQSGVNSSVYSLIETSNPVFGQVKRLWNSPVESHREICAVLAAVSDVIKANGGQDTETEYFAALLTALESSEDEKSTTAVAFLLSVVMERVPEAILQTQFGSVCKLLMTQLSVNESAESTALIKSLVSCVSVLLSAQPASVWVDSYVQTILQSLMNFIIHQKPKLRKAAQKGLISMLREGIGINKDDFHPSCSLVTKHCKYVIEKGGVETSKLHILGFLKDCLGNFPAKNIKTLCEMILNLITLGNSVTKTTGFQCLNGLFRCKAGPQGLTSQLNGQLISALYDQQPSLVDSQLLMAWITVIESAHLSLQNLDSSLCLAHLPKLFTVCMNCLLAKKKVVTNLIANVMKNILKTCIPTSVSILKVAESDIPKKGKRNEKAEKSTEYSYLLAIFRTIESGLKYKYYSVWYLVLGVLETFYTIAGESCYKFMTKSLKSLNELNNTQNFPCTSELQSAFGAAVQSMGPRIVLEAVPLRLDEISGHPDFPQSWILPLLKDYIQQAELAYYVQDLLPMAGQMRLLAQEWREKGRALEAKLYDTLETQIWSLLPSFCKNPTDVSASFSSIAKLLGTALSEKSEIRSVVCQSLVNLIEGSRNNDLDRNELAKFSKNYLPLLFNLYTADPVLDEPPRDPLLNCIKAYVSVTNQKLLQSLFSILLSKLQDQSSQPHVKTALEDMTVAFVPFLPHSALTDLFQLISPFLDSGDTSTQKKAYRLLSTILSCTSPDHTSFINEHLVRLKEVLLSSLSTAGAGSKKPRLRCLIQVVSRLNPDGSEFISAIIPEVILCTKEANEKCRNLAYQLLTSLCYAAQKCYMKTPEESVQDFFTVVLAGLAGSSHMISATIGSMARLVYQFNDLIGSELIKKLLTSVCVFLSAKAKEVVRSVLIFIKVAIGVLPPEELAPHVEDLIESVLKWNDNHKNHFRLKARYLLERLIRKFSFEMVAGFVPQKHKRLMVHIRKMQERHKRKRKDKWEGRAKGDDEDIIVKRTASKPSFDDLLVDSSDEDEEETKFKKKGKTLKERGKQTKGSAWLKEGEADEPLDFLDSSVTHRIIGTKPNRRSKPSETFQTGSDGKLIIYDEDEENIEGVSDANKIEIMETGEDTDKRTKRKRKISVIESDDEENHEIKGSRSGIHRKDPVKMKFKDYGAEYRAKKAKGDIKKAGKPDPYAYIQLDRQKLNKRKRAKLSGQFHGILNKAKKGAALGRKQKRRKK